jgi:anti-sigma B factor antagonist
MESNEAYQQFATVLEEIGDKWVVHVLGDIDLSSALELEAAIDQAATFGAPVVVDLRECRYMDSTGLTALVRAVKRYGRVEAVVTEHSPISRIVQITGFQKVLPIVFESDAVPGLSTRRSHTARTKLHAIGTAHNAASE